MPGPARFRVWTAPNETVCRLMASIIRRESGKTVYVVAADGDFHIEVKGGLDRWSKKVPAMARNLKDSTYVEDASDVSPRARAA